MAVMYSPVACFPDALQLRTAGAATAGLAASVKLYHLDLKSNTKQPIGAINPCWKRSAPEDRRTIARVSFLSQITKKSREETRERLKEQLLEAIATLDRGVKATPQDQELIDKMARKLEMMNQVKEPLKSGLLNGKWELLYTTSQSILQTKRPIFLRPFGKIYQAINLDTLRAQNMETWPFFNQITANLVPLNARRTAVKFDYFKIAGLIRVKNPGSGRGQIEITYLDEELRISRGDKGNLFILRMVDPSYRVPM